MAERRTELARVEVTQVDVALDRSSPVPLYHQLAEALEAAVHDGRLPPGDRLENELSLAARLGVARPTVRQAIQELTKKGLVVRKRGVGTQVLAARISRDTRLSSLYDDLEAAGRRPSTTLLQVSTGPFEADVTSLLAEAFAESGGGPGESVTMFRRVRGAGTTPLAILTNYVPDRYRITAADLADRGLYACLRAQGVSLRAAHQRVGARLLSQTEAGLLAETSPAVGLTATRTVFDDAGRLVELGRHVYRASHYSMDVSLVP